MKFIRLISLIFLFQIINIGVNAQLRTNFLQYGSVDLRNEKYLEAIGYFNQAIQLEPNSYYAYYLRGIAKFNLDDISGAEMDFTTAINLLPYYSDFFHNRANARSILLRYEDAFKDYKRALEIDSTDASIYFDRAKTYLNLQKYDEAIADCDKAISLKYNHESIYILRGSAKAGGKYYDDALQDMNLVLDYNPDYLLGYIQRGKVFIELEKADSAIMDFDFVLQKEPKNSYALFNRSLARMRKSDYDSALKDLDEVLKISPYNSYAHFNKAIIYIYQDKKADAIKAFDEVIKINPKNITSYFYRGKLKSDLKDYKGALDDFNKTIEIHPSFSNGYQERSIIKSRMGLFDEAEKDYNKAVELGNLTDLETENLTQEKIAYLNSLVQLSGEFTEVKENDERPQYQYFAIDMLPIFQQVPKPEYRDTEKYYDAYRKLQLYDQALISLSNNPVQHNVQSISIEIEKLSTQIDSSNRQTADYLKRANLYASIQNFNNAFEDYEKSLELDSTAIMAYFSRANSKFYLTELIKSIGYKQQAVTISTEQKNTDEEVDNSNKQYLLEAIEDYNKVLKLDPDFPYAYYNRAYVKCLIGEYQRAVDDFTFAIQKNGNFSEAFYNRGLILLFLNENKLGCQDLSKAGELGISNAYAVMKRYCHK